MQTLDKLTANLGMDKLLEPTTMVDIQNAVSEIFGDGARKVNPDGDGEKVYVYGAMRILQEVSCTWARLYEVVASSGDKELRASSDLRAQLAQMEKIHDGQRIKL